MESKNISVGVLLVQPGKFAKQCKTELSVETLKQLLSGELQIDCPFDEEDICLVKGPQDAKLPNRAIYDDMHNIKDIVYGTFIVCGIEQNGDLRGLDEEEMGKYWSKYDNPELFFGMEDGETKVVCRHGDNYYVHSFNAQKEIERDLE